MEDELIARGAACIFSKPFRPADVADFLQRLASSIDCARFSLSAGRCPTPARRTNRGVPGAMRNGALAEARLIKPW
jgi:hypothetical protein